MGGVSFYHDKEHGPMARMKGGPSSRQVKKGANFKNTRRNNEEFGRASHYGLTIRTAFSYLVSLCMNKPMNTKLMSRLKEIIRMDRESEWGKRDLCADTLASFTHFELDGSNLSRQYFSKQLITIAKNGSLEVTSAISLRTKPLGMCKWRVVSISAGINFRKHGSYDCNMQESELLDFENGDYALSFTHYYDTQLMLFHGIAIVFYEYDAVNDRYLPSKQQGVNSGFLRFVQG